jgi:hypothetical protein
VRTISVNRGLLAQLRLAAEDINPEVVRKPHILRPAVKISQQTRIALLDHIILRAILAW